MAIEPPNSTSAVAERVSDDLRMHMAIGAAALVVLVGGLGGWAATAELAGAVIAQGTVVVDSNIKKVQHPTGGIVGEIRVRDGDKVAAAAARRHDNARQLADCHPVNSTSWRYGRPA